MDKDWIQHLEETRQEIEKIEKRKSEINNVRKILSYIAAHPRSGKLSELIHINGDEVIGKALLRMKTGISYDCLSNNKFETCNILECLYCGNSEYDFILETNDSIKKRKRNKDFYPDEYEILFYDIIPNEKEIFSYLFDKESRYKILRKIDNIEIIDTTFKIRASIKNKKLIKQKI